MLSASKWRARMLCAIPSKSGSSTWSGVPELSDEECLQRLFQNCTNELYDKHHYVFLHPSSLLSVTHLRKSPAVINSTECPRNTPSKVNQSDHRVLNLFAEQGWCSSESSRLPPVWPGFDFLTRRHMWVESDGSLLFSERFFPGYSGFTLSPRTNI